jgi:hypothetical protein
VCNKVAHLKEGEVGQRSGSFICARTGCVGGAEGPSARFGALASLLFYGVRDHEIKSMEASKARSTDFVR